MTGFLIALSLRCLSHPQDIDLRVLEAAMFFPDDASRREAYERTAEIDFLIQAKKLMGSKEVSIAVAEEALSTKPLDLPDSDYVERGIKGMLAGWILDQAIARKGSMKAIFMDASKASSAIWSATPKTIEQYAWAKFKCVAHFWAARKTMEDSGYALEKFPCNCDQLATFLGIATAMSRRATTTGLKQSRWGTIILPQDVARLPDGLNIPDVPLKIV
jgi:hypothetical protein